MSQKTSQIRQIIPWVVTLLSMMPCVVSAQAVQQDINQVIVVPFSQNNPNLPHPGHEDAPITLKAIIRNAQCDSYVIKWDANRDGNYNNDPSVTRSRNATTLSVYDIGRTFIIPNVSGDTSMNINVEVTPNCGGQVTKYGTFKLFVYDFTPSTDPRNWTGDQVEIMTSMAIQESLWYVHRMMVGHSGRDSNSISAYSGYEYATGIHQWFFVINNHLPAYPPNTLVGPSPAGWTEKNNLRWANDPYAESSMRLLNYLVARTNQSGIPGEDEANTCGYRGANVITNCSVDGTASTSIPAADDGAGFYMHNSPNTHQDVYLTGLQLGGIPPSLPALNGTNVQVGLARNTPWNYFVQQLVDHVGYQQMDSGCGNGGWYYQATGASDCGYSDLSSTQWAYIGLDSAESAGTPYGVFVNNRHKYRIANNAYNNQRADGGGAYRSTGSTSDFKLTGGSVLSIRWLGMQNMNPASNGIPFPNESGLTFAQLRSVHDRYMSFVQTWFTARRVNGTHWQDGLWRNGDYLCGNTSTVYNVPDRCGNTYSMYSHQKGYRTGTPALDRIGNNDWYRMFSIYFVRAQSRRAVANDPWSNYSDFGAVYDDYCEAHSVTCVYGAGQLSSIMGGLVMTPALFKPKPVAIGSISPLQVTEGCLTGNGKVSVTHQSSFHPNADASIVNYYWDMNAADGLWWNTGANPDVDINGSPMRTNDRLKVLDYVYQNRGTFTATLRVEDNAGLFKEVTVPAVTVTQAANVPPSIATGGPYVIEDGQNLQLNATASDSNLNCGDRVTVTWNLNPNIDPTYETTGEKTLVNWSANFLGVLPKNVANTILVKVVDSANASSVQQTQLYIYDKNPIAIANVIPAQAACNQEVTFDGSASRHPNPQRIVSNYSWSVDGQTGGNAIFKTSFNSYGVKTAQLTVTDDLGRTGQATVNVNINQGNLPPVIRVPSVQITIPSNQILALDARLSTDPNADCGDSIARYEWHFNGDATADFIGDLVNVPIADWQRFMGYPNNKTLVIKAKLIDTLGASSEQQITITAIQAEPVPSIAQNPNPSPYRLDNGRSSTFLSGLESRSLLPNTVISRYQWDIDCNGSYEYEGGQVLYEKTFAPNTSLQQIRANPITVCLKVTDSNGTSAISAPYTIQYQVSGNTSPTADADPSDPPEKEYHILNGQNLILDGSKSFDPDTALGFNDYIKEYRWTINQRNQPEFVKAAANANDNAAKTLTLTPAQMTSIGMQVLEQVYPLSLEVTDTTNNKSSDTSNIYIHKKTATLGVLINPPNTAPGARVTFDASQTKHTHPDLTVTQVIWIFGTLQSTGVQCVTDANCNGNGYCINNPSNNRLECIKGSVGSAEGVNASFTFNQITPPGTPAIPVTVIVRDSNGGQAQSGYGEDVNTTYSIRVDQGNRPPVSNPGGGLNLSGQVVGPYTMINDARESIVFSGAASSDPDSIYGDSIVNYTWTVGTCTFNEVNATLAPKTLAQLNACGIVNNGVYPIKLRVTDRFGTTAESTVNLNLVPVPQPIGTANPNRVACQQLVTFDGRGSNYFGPLEQGFNISKYSWDINGDGVEDSSQASFSTAVTALPSNNIVQVTATLTITDAIGVAAILNNTLPNGHQQKTTVPVTIDVQNQPPQANAGGPYVTGPTILNGVAGFAPVTADGRRSIDPNAPCDAVTAYAWDTDGDGLYGRDDTNGPTTINGVSSDYEGAQISFTKANWQIGTTDTIRLRVKDSFGSWSVPAEAQVQISAEVPPTGNIVSPRANSCVSKVNGNQSNATVEVFHLATPPKNVLVKLYVGAVEVGSTRVVSNSFDANKKATVTIPINLTLVPEGLNELVAEYILEDTPVIRTNSNSGGRITFDYQAPVITLGNQPADGVCYANGRVPDPVFSVMDNFDATPQTNQATTENGCVRTLNITATDVCGNSSQASRNYLVAQTVTANITGITEGALLANARINWTIPGSPACAPTITSTLKRNALAAAPYVANTLVNTAGNYAFTLNVSNCLGVANQQVINFAINAPPVAVAITPGHPNADPNNIGSYIVNEGSPLVLDASASTPPEQRDSISAYEWDVDRNGTVDFRGQTYSFDTNVNGVKQVRLTVKDSLNAAATKDFQVTIRDISPVADGGGPYGGTQGQVITFSAARSRSLAPTADPLTRYVWAWGDGTPNSEGVEVTHAFAAQGAYNVTLTVFDEDNSSSIVVGAVISDVDPQIRGAQISAVQGKPVQPSFPVTGPEIQPVTFVVDAQAGTLSDPITAYQWDFNGDNVFEKTTTVPYVDWQFMSPGTYNVTVLVRDRDSFSQYTLPVTVQPVSWETLLAYTLYQVSCQLTPADVALACSDLVKPTRAITPFERSILTPLKTKINRGIWGQKYDGLNDDPIAEFPNSPLPGRTHAQHIMHQGISSMATRTVIQDLTQLQSTGLDFGHAIWSLSRQLVREASYDFQAIQRNAEGILANRTNDPMYQTRINLAQQKLNDANAFFNAMGFERDARLLNGASQGLASQLELISRQSNDWMSLAVDYCNDPTFQDFNVDQRNIVNFDPIAYSSDAEIARQRILNALTNMQTEMENYSSRGTNTEPAPGSNEILNAITIFNDIVNRTNKRVDYACRVQNANNLSLCSDDRNALEVELEIMDLINELQAASTHGAYVLPWQSCLVQFLRMRIEISLQKVRYQCSLNNPLTIQAFEAYDDGLAIYRNNDVLGVLSYYADPSIKCLILDVYNRCLVPADATLQGYDYPDICLQ